MTNILQHFRSIRNLLKIRVRSKEEFKMAASLYRSTLRMPNSRTITSTVAIRTRRDFRVLQNSTVLVEKDDNITLIGISREENRNSVDLATSKALIEAMNKFEMDSDSPVAVLYGVGGSFSAGHDVIELEQQLEQKNLNYLFKSEGSIASTRRHLKKPIVCAINGYCIAGGLELALLCDLRVMEDTAVIGFFNRKFGVPICDGGTVRLAKQIGFSRAMDMIASGRRMHAKEAFEIGLVNRIVATGTALGQAVNLAFSISKFSQKALLHDRISIYNNVFEGKTFDETVQDQMILTDDLIKELKTGVHKFVKSETKGAKVDSFNIKEKPVPDWEKEEIRIELEYKRNNGL